MAERELQVTSRLGLHARAAANLVRVASRFQSSLTLQRLDGNAEADAKSILSILTLAASRGTALRIVASGVDEQEALDAVVGLSVAQGIVDGVNPLRRFPQGEPPIDECGLRMEIWY